MAQLVEIGEVNGHVDELMFRDPDHFVVGELHNHAAYWAEIARLAPSLNQEAFRHLKGTFKGERYDSDRPSPRIFRNNVSCKQFEEFVKTTLLSRLRARAISLVGKVHHRLI